jgi:hypothetical protein
LACHQHPQPPINSLKSEGAIYTAAAFARFPKPKFIFIGILQVNLCHPRPMLTHAREHVGKLGLRYSRSTS